MSDALGKILSVSSDSIGYAGFDSSGLPDGVAALLVARNGFYAFESALHVFHAGTRGEEYDVASWNEDALWRFEYSDLARGFYFFAEDVFGCQFAERNGEVFSFDPETGAAERVGSSVYDWVETLMSDYAVMTGWRLAHDWQARFGALPRGHRLVPRIPFVCGGDFSVENLVSIESVAGMRARGNLARQIRDLPDGSKIEFSIK